MGLYSNNRTFNIATDTGLDTNEDYSGGTGIYSKSGGYRVNTTDPGPGLYAADGALRGVVNDTDTPSPGAGVYHPSGAYRFVIVPSSLFNGRGIYSTDGAFKATITNLA